MYRHGYRFDEMDTIVAGYHGPQDGVIPGITPTDARPDWIIKSEPDHDPMPPEDDGVPAALILDGLLRPVREVNSQWSPVADLEGEIYGARAEFAAAGLDWRTVLPRFFRIFHGLELSIHTGTGDYRQTHHYFALPSEEWRAATGYYGPITDDTFNEWRAYYAGEMKVWSLWEWDAGEGVYVSQESVHCVVPLDHGPADRAYALSLFGLSDRPLTADYAVESSQEVAA